MIANIWRWFFGSKKGLGLHNTPAWRMEQARLDTLTEEEKQAEILELLNQVKGEGK